MDSKNENDKDNSFTTEEDDEDFIKKARTMFGK
jgi:hypothetical protein